MAQPPHTDTEAAHELQDVSLSLSPGIVAPSEPSTEELSEGMRFLNSLDVNVTKLGLSRIQKVLDAMENPQNRVPTVHIAGTNGKGSVTAMVDAVLREAGYKTGTTTSPHLSHPRERITLEGEALTDEAFEHRLIVLKHLLEASQWDKEDWPTYFEAIIAMAFQSFHQNNVDIAIVETGLGGRLDATNIIENPLCSVITTISLDHTEHLGDALEAIAREKAGIIKAQHPVVVGATIAPEALEAIEAISQEQGSPVIYATPNRISFWEMDPEQRFQVVRDNQRRTNYELGLLGIHQADNLSTALAVIEELSRGGYRISHEAIEAGIRKVQWPARFQYNPQTGIIIDGSHNEAGFQGLGKSLATYFAQKPNTRPFVWMVSLRSNRDIQPLRELVSRFNETDTVICTLPEQKPQLFHRPEALVQFLMDDPNLNDPARHVTLESLEELNKAHKAFKKRMAILQAKGHQPLGIITGSLYTAGAISEKIQAH